MLTIHTLILGPIENNTIIVADDTTGEAIVVDPSFELEPILDLLEENEYRLRAILLTHAHFDHSVNTITPVKSLQPAYPDRSPLRRSISLGKWWRGGFIWREFQAIPESRYSPVP